MGASSSTRKLTIPNKEEVGVIKLSTAIVERLQGSGETAANVAATDTAEVGTSFTLAAPLPERNFAPPPSGEVPPYPTQYPGFTISALQMQQSKQREIEDQEAYWRNRLRNLQKNHEKINKILEDEYKRAVEEYSTPAGKREAIAKYSAVPCTENSQKVLKCYQDHPKEILKCSELVEEFSNCVDQRRARLIAARC
ncbi:uncharacterized protein LOC105697737 isoform X2 [Orussus abietinus]|nr:uncharacterized protein LOC105697737 isoform X2 [Orussus abietinus]XP_012276776.1 uncharacterized protein LOC105697737 isoform X2 [Orussus abietinus]